QDGLRRLRDVPHLQAVEVALDDVVPGERKIGVEEAEVAGIGVVREARRLRCRSHEPQVPERLRRVHPSGAQADAPVGGGRGGGGADLGRRRDCRGEGCEGERERPAGNYRHGRLLVKWGDCCSILLHPRGVWKFPSCSTSVSSVSASRGRSSTHPSFARSLASGSPRSCSAVTAATSSTVSRSCSPGRSNWSSSLRRTRPTIRSRSNACWRDVTSSSISRSPPPLPKPKSWCASPPSSAASCRSITIAATSATSSRCGSCSRKGSSVAWCSLNR